MANVLICVGQAGLAQVAHKTARLLDFLRVGGCHYRANNPRNRNIGDAPYSMDCLSRLNLKPARLGGCIIQMTDVNEKLARSESAENSDVFAFGAPLPAGHESYLARAADEELLHNILAGHYVHVLAPVRSGKTSLLANVASELEEKDCLVAVLDLAQIGARGGAADAGRWYYTIAYRLLRQLRIKFDLQTWWHDRSILSNRQRLFEFYVEVILRKSSKQVVIFIDEAQSLFALPFAAQFLASVRAAFDARFTDPEFARLSFVLLGEGDPELFATDSESSPFTISNRVVLEDFQREDIGDYGKHLGLVETAAQQALDRIYYWTGGQPHLLQKLSRLVCRENLTTDIEADIDRIVKTHLTGRVALHSEPHLLSIERGLIHPKKESEALLNLYGQIAKGIVIVFDHESIAQRRLLSSGLIDVSVSGELRPRNRIYREVFTAKWANQRLPLHLRGLAIIVAAVLLIMLIPIWYTQFLPRSYIDDLSSPSGDLISGWEAYSGLKSFPGHAQNADRLYGNFLDNAAKYAGSEEEMSAVAAAAHHWTGNYALARKLTAAYWDRQTALEMEDERRDMALLASLEALVVSSPRRRQTAGALVGDDYPRLIGAHSALAPFDSINLDGKNSTVSYIAGASVRQTQLVNGEIRRREPWSITALDVVPLVRRVEIDRDGRATRLGLAVNVSHTRVDDLQLKLISPSGRAVELDLNISSSSANDIVRFEPRELADLRGESLRGTWSLSIRDEKTGVAGQLLAWHLSLNSQVVVEEFERGMDIGDPQPLDSDRIWFDPNGRYAVARISRNENARIWDLTSAQVTGTVSIPLNETIIGLANNGVTLLTATQNSVHLWNTQTGKSGGTLLVGTGAPNSIIVGEGKHLLALTMTEQDAHLELWSLQTRSKLDSFDVAGAPALIAVNSRGTRVAIADYDRAVRVRAIPGGEFLAQYSLTMQPSAMRFAANGDVLAVLYANEGISVWNIDGSEQPVLADWGPDNWNIVFSPSGDRFIAGGSLRGYRIFRSRDGVPAGPNLDIGSNSAGADLLGFSEDEQVVITAANNGLIRFWDSKSTLTVGAGETVQGGRVTHNDSGQSLAAISPDGTYLAATDRAGHVHIQSLSVPLNATQESLTDELSFMGHRGAIDKLVFSRDGKLLASGGRDGMVRIWDVESGIPRPFLSRGPAGIIQNLELSPSGRRLAAISGSRIWLMDTADGKTLAELEMGELHPALVFANDEQIYIGAGSGVLRSIEADRVGQWSLRPIWKGEAAIKFLDFAPRNSRLAIGDAAGQVRLLQTRDGSIGSSVLQLPGVIRDLRFTPGETHVVARTLRWLHRATVSPSGLVKFDVIPTSGIPPNARMSFMFHM